MALCAVRLMYVASLIACLATASWGAGPHVVGASPGPMTTLSDEGLSDLEAVADKAFQEGRYPEALRSFAEAIRISPACSRFHYGSGMAHEMMKNPTAAMRDYIQAIRWDPQNYKAMENLAGIVERTGRSPKDAIRLYKTALALDPRPVWKENLAVWIRMLQSTLRTGEESAVEAWNLGNSRAQKGKDKEAVSWYTEAIRLNPLFFQAYYSRALLRLKIGDPDAALADLNAAIDMSPGLRGALVQRALVYERLGKRLRAVNDLRRAVQVDRGDPEAHYQLGRMEQEDGRYQAAAEAFRQALQLKPKPDLRTLIHNGIVALRGTVLPRQQDSGRKRGK